MTVNLHRVLVIIVVICVVVIFLIIFAVQSSSSPALAGQSGRYMLSWIPQQFSSARVWQQSQQTDAFRGTYTRFTLMGKFLNAPQGDVSNSPTLAVDCNRNQRFHRSKFVHGNLLVGAPLKVDWVEPTEIHGTSYFPKVAVRYRFDDVKEEKENWSAGADRTSVFFSKDWLKKMLRARTVEITAGDDRRSQVVMQFDMPDPAPVEQACDVDNHKK